MATGIKATNLPNIVSAGTSVNLLGTYRQNGVERAVLLEGINPAPLYQGAYTSTQIRIDNLVQNVSALFDIVSVVAQSSVNVGPLEDRISAVSALAVQSGVPTSIRDRLAAVSGVATSTRGKLNTTSARITSVNARFAIVSAKGTSNALVLSQFKTSIRGRVSLVSLIAVAGQVPSSVYSRLSGVSSRLVIVSGKTTSVATRIGIVSGKGTSVRTRLETASAKITSVNSQFNGFRSSIRTRINNVSVLAAAGGGGSPVPTSVYTRLSGVSTRQATVSGRVTSIRTRFATVSGKVTSITTRLATVSAKGTSVRTRLATVSAKGTSVRTRLATTSANATSVRNRLNSVSIQLSNLSVITVLNDSALETLSYSILFKTYAISAQLSAVSVIAAAGGGGGVPSSVMARLSGVSVRQATVSGRVTSITTRLATVSAKGTSVRTRLATVSAKGTSVNNRVRYARLTSRFLTSSGSLTDIPGLSFSVSANTSYVFELIGAVFTSITTQGGAFGIAFPQSSKVTGFCQIANNATNMNTISQKSNGTLSQDAGTIYIALEPSPCWGRWYVRTESTAGTVKLQIRSEGAGINFWAYENMLFRMEKVAV